MLCANLKLRLLIVVLITWMLNSVGRAECPCNRSNGADPLVPMPMQTAQSTYEFNAMPNSIQYGDHSSAMSRSSAMYGNVGMEFTEPMLTVPGQYVQPFQQRMNDHYQNSQRMPAWHAGAVPYLTQYTQRTVPTPPPGTIGQTFKLPSRPVPVEKHPRVGMLDVKVADAKSIIVHDMNAMRTEDTIDGFKDAIDKDIWHFETKPLYPGLDHIYRIQVTFEEPAGKERKAEKYVRLIMGRVVELTF